PTPEADARAPGSPRPPYECPTRMVGPSVSAMARFTVATSASRELSGSWTAVARKPRLCKSGITLAHDEPSAQAPCTRTILDALAMLLLSSPDRQCTRRPSVSPGCCAESF